MSKKEWTPEATDTCCGVKTGSRKCLGWLANVTRGIDERLGLIVLECDECHSKWSVKWRSSS